MNYDLVDFHCFIEKSDRKNRHSKTNKQLIHKEIFLAKNHIFLSCIEIICIFAGSKVEKNIKSITINNLKLIENEEVISYSRISQPFHGGLQQHS
jgi:hypothetical protein